LSIRLLTTNSFDVDRGILNYKLFVGFARVNLRLKEGSLSQRPPGHALISGMQGRNDLIGLILIWGALDRDLLKPVEVGQSLSQLRNPCLILWRKVRVLNCLQRSHAAISL
jgi:hypothetical protein